MHRFLFAWELGANYGHLVRDLCVAERLRTEGHEVVFAVSDTRIAVELLKQRRFAFFQAPFSRRTAKLAHPPGNYAELLLAENWGDRVELLGLTEAWLHLFQSTRAEVIVADHAPTALLASLISGTTSIAMGSGFEIPPARCPLPSIRPWERISGSSLLQSENAVLNSINFVCNSLGARPLQRVADLIPLQQVLTTFPELDHYGPRDAGTYVGSIHGMEIGDEVHWKSDARPHILSYLRPTQRAIDAALAALSDMEAETLCVVPGGNKSIVRKYSTSRVSISSRPIRLHSLLESADVAVCYGSAGMMAECLLAGVPLLMIPDTIEQYLGAKRVAVLGAGIIVENDRGKEAIRLKLETLVADSSYRQAAQRFAMRYLQISSESAAIAAATALTKYEPGKILNPFYGDSN